MVARMSMNCVEDAFASSSRGLEASHARVLISIASSSTLQSNLLSSDLIYHIGIRPQFWHESCLGRLSGFIVWNKYDERKGNAKQSKARCTEFTIDRLSIYLAL